MKEIIVPYGSMNFETISEFKRSINWGAEIEFEWNGVCLISSDMVPMGK